MTINCSVTVMPVLDGCIGFVRRSADDTFGGKLVAPGGHVEESDGELMGGVPYNSVEEAGIRELFEETGITVSRGDLWYFCSLTLPKSGTVVISMYTVLEYEDIPVPVPVGAVPGIIVCDGKATEFIAGNVIADMDKEEFAPGMKEEALLLIDRCGVC